MNYVLDTCTYYWLVDDQTELTVPALGVLGDINNSLYPKRSRLTTENAENTKRSKRLGTWDPTPAG